MPYYISHEDKVNTYPQSDFMRFFISQVITGYWKQASGVSIFYGYVINETARKCIVISQGRSESVVKYAEFIFELYQNGYSVFIHDHQGQGQSTRLLANSQIGHVANFYDYVDDLHALVENVLSPILLDHSQNELPKTLICHSMGGAIGSLYVLAHPQVFSQIIMSAPMFGIITPANEPVTYFFVRCIHKLSQFLGVPERYIWGQRDYEANPFEQNKLTNSEIRYRVFREMMFNYPQNRLGGISFTWMLSAIMAMREMRTKISNISVPILVFQAQQEYIVDNKRMTEFVNALPHGRMVKVANSKHEMLFEKDQVRQLVLTAIFDFLSRGQVN